MVLFFSKPKPLTPFLQIHNMGSNFNKICIALVIAFLEEQMQKHIVKVPQ